MNLLNILLNINFFKSTKQEKKFMSNKNYMTIYYGFKSDSKKNNEKLIDYNHESKQNGNSSLQNQKI